MELIPRVSYETGSLPDNLHYSSHLKTLVLIKGCGELGGVGLDGFSPLKSK